MTVMHLLVDGVCGAVLAIYAIKEPHLEPIIFYFGLYTIFAFGLQGPVGWLLDKAPTYNKKAIVASTLLLALGTIPQLTIGMQAVLLGLGNCLFHVVGGSYVLRKYSTYSELGLFVSSGAIGLGLGLYGIISVWPLLALACLFTGLAVKNMQELTREDLTFSPNVLYENSSNKLLGIVALLFGCIVLRGFGSGNVLESSFIMLLPCTFALGKLLGGFVCDKIGYKKTVLLILFIGFVGLKIQGLYGGLLFVLASNMTMPLTLRLAHWCRIGAPGLMFGLAASCLVPGTIFKDLISLPPQLILVLQFLILVIAGFALLKKEYQYG
ncbi:MAG: hypothetical protein MJ055_04425 [Phascolarctobacterium sp.]|nr:hypothetical protein [Phascolarctobacterium sp.]